MKTKNKNAMKNLLEIRADFHKETFGKHVTWEIKNVGTKSDPAWNVDIYEDQDNGFSFNYEHIARMAMIAMVSQWMGMEERKGRKVVKFHLY